MRVEALVLVCISTNIVRAGPIPKGGLGWLLRRQLNATDVQAGSASPLSTASSGGQVGIVPAIGVNPDTPRISIAPIQLSASQLGGGLASSRRATRTATAGLARSNGTSTTTLANSAATGKIIGIVPAVPNDPVNSPPLTTIAPVAPAIVSSLNAALLAGNNTAIAATSPNAINPANTSTTIPATQVTSSAFGVSITTFPLVGGSSPQPAAAPQPSGSTSTLTSPRGSQIQPIPLAATLSGNGVTYVTTTLLVTRTRTTSTPDAMETATAKRKSKHHHSGNRSNTAQLSIQTAPSSQSGSPLLIVPDIATMTSAAPRTITVAANQGSGIAIVPVNTLPGNVNANAVTVTVTETVAEKTQTVVIISTTTAVKV